MKNDKKEYISVKIKDENSQSPVSYQNNDDIASNHDVERTNENSD